MTIKARNAINKFCLTLCLSLAGTVCSAEDITKPFGPFQWGMGLVETIHAAQSLPGSPSVKLLLDYHINRLGATSNYIGTASKEYALPNNASKRDIMRALYEQAIISRRNYSSENSYTIQGNNFQSTEGVTIKIDSVSIAGIPFYLYVSMKSYPGYAVQSPMNVLNDASGQIFYPVVLEWVGLISDSAAISNQKSRDEIANTICQKYVGKLEMSSLLYGTDAMQECVDRMHQDFNGGVEFSEKSSQFKVEVGIHRNVMAIDYFKDSSDYYNNIYKNQKSSEAIKSTSTIPNQSGSL